MTTVPRASLATEYEGDVRKATDDLLTLAARSGNGPAFVELSRRHSKKIQLHAYRILGNWEDAEDVVQESLLKAFKHLDQFRGTCAFSSWLRKIATNSALMLLRKRRARLETSCDKAACPTESSEAWDFPDDAPGPERLCSGRETEELLRGAILRLPSGYRTVVELYHAEECSVTETAQALGLSLAATKARLFRAKTMLRASLPRLVYRDFDSRRM